MRCLYIKANLIPPLIYHSTLLPLQEVVTILDIHKENILILYPQVTSYRGNLVLFHSYLWEYGEGGGGGGGSEVC